MKDLRKVAIKAVTLAKIMEDRDKLDTEDLIDRYGDHISVDEVEYVTIQKTVPVKGSDDKETEVDEFWAFHFKESPDTFSFAGFVLAKIFNALLEEAEGDFEALNAELQKYPIELRLSRGKTKNKQPITLVEVL